MHIKFDKIPWNKQLDFLLRTVSKRPRCEAVPKQKSCKEVRTIWKRPINKSTTET